MRPPTDVRRLLEWRHRIKRDTDAMQAIVRRVLGPHDSAVDVGAHEGEFVTWFLDAAPREVIQRDRPVLLFEHARVHAASFGVTAHDVWAWLDGVDYSVAPVADGSQVLDEVGFVALCEVGHSTAYDRRAVTNWIARPR